MFQVQLYFSETHIDKRDCDCADLLGDSESQSKTEEAIKRADIFIADDYHNVIIITSCDMLVQTVPLRNWDLKHFIVLLITNPC